MVEFRYHVEWYTLLMIDIIDWNDLETLIKKFTLNSLLKYSIIIFNPKRLLLLYQIPRKNYFRSVNLKSSNLAQIENKWFFLLPVKSIIQPKIQYWISCLTIILIHFSNFPSTCYHFWHLLSYSFASNRINISVSRRFLFEIFYKIIIIYCTLNSYVISKNYYSTLIDLNWMFLSSLHFISSYIFHDYPIQE